MPQPDFGEGCLIRSSPIVPEPTGI